MTSKYGARDLGTRGKVEDSPHRTVSRRTFLGAVSVAGLAPALQDGGNQTGGNESGGDRTEGDGAVDTHIELTGEVDGWNGRSPSEIDGETNPTLNLQAGNRYRVTWKNADGAPHNFTILDADGNQITSTEIVSIQGETRSLTFTATREMAQYYCAVHTNRMRGEIQIDGETQTDDTPTEVGADVDIVFELGGVVGGWQGRLPETREADQTIEGEKNPTLELEAGSRYMVIWENADGVPHNFTVKDADGNDIIATETTSNSGEKLSLTFTATREMDQYVCTIHPSTMQGDIQVSGNGVGKMLTKDSIRMAGSMAAVTVGSVVGASYLLSRYFEESHEP